MSSTSTQFFAMLLGQIPMLLVYLGAIVASLIFWRRHPRPALLVMIAAVLLIAVTLTWPLVQTWAMEQRATGNVTTSQFGQRLAVLSLATTTVRAAAYALLVSAAFVGRRSENPQPAFPVVAAFRDSVPPPLPR